MDDMKNARKRIKNRRYGGKCDERSHRPHTLFKLCYRFCMLLMGVCVFVLALLLNQKLNLVQLPASIQNFKIENLSSWLPFENWFSLKEEAVASIPAYSLLKENQYSNGSNIAYGIKDGVVLHVKKVSDGKTQVRIKQDNGVIVTYGSLSEVSLKQGERILKGRPLGTYTSFITIDFLKANKAITYDQALLNTTD